MCDVACNSNAGNTVIWPMWYFSKANICLVHFAKAERACSLQAEWLTKSLNSCCVACQADVAERRVRITWYLGWLATRDAPVGPPTSFTGAPYSQLGASYSVPGYDWALGSRWGKHGHGTLDGLPSLSNYSSLVFSSLPPCATPPQCHLWE